MSCFPCLIRSSKPTGETRFARGDPLVDFDLELVAGRARPNPLRSVAFDLKTLFVVAEKYPVEVVAADIFEFPGHQGGDRKMVRLQDVQLGERSLSIAEGKGGHHRVMRFFNTFFDEVDEHLFNERPDSASVRIGYPSP